MSEELEQKEQSPEEVEAAAEAAMAAGFNSVRGEPAPEPEEPAATTSDEPPEEKPDDQEAQDAPPGETQPEKAGLANLTEAQLQDLIAKANRVDVLASALHRTQSDLGRLKAQLQKPPQPKEAPKPPEPPQLKRLREDYPNVAEALAPDIAELLASNKGASSTEIEALVEKAVATSTGSVQREMLEIVRPNWEEQARDAKFLAWLDSQPAEYANRARTSERASVVLATFADYEKSLKPVSAPAAEAKDTAEQAAAKKQRRLEGAITPSGARVPPNAGKTEEQAFAAGFYGIRGTANR